MTNLLKNYLFKKLEECGDGGGVFEASDGIIDFVVSCLGEDVVFDVLSRGDVKLMRKCFEDVECDFYIEFLTYRPRNLSLKKVFYRHNWNDSLDNYTVLDVERGFGYRLYKWGNIYFLSSGFCDK